MSTLEIKLGIAALGAVYSNVLDPNEVLARRSVPGKGERNGRPVPGAPVLVVQVPSRGGFADYHLVHLEPVAVAPVVADVAGGSGHVDRQGAGMLHGRVVPELESDGVAGHDFGDLGLGRVGEGARVAAEVVARRQELLGGHDSVAVLADVLEVGREFAVDEELAEAVVR